MRHSEAVMTIPCERPPEGVHSTIVSIFAATREEAEKVAKEFQDHLGDKAFGVLGTEEAPDSDAEQDLSVKFGVHVEADHDAARKAAGRLMFRSEEHGFDFFEVKPLGTDPDSVAARAVHDFF